MPAYSQAWIQRWYSGFAPIYDLATAWRFHRARRWLVQELHIEPGSTVLDLGCGTGLNFPLLVDAVGGSGRVIGVDYNEGMLKQASRRVDRRGYAQVTVGQLDARELSSQAIEKICDEPVEVDVAIAALLLSVVPDWEDVFVRMWDLVRPGGTVGILDGAPLRGPLTVLAAAENMGAAANVHRPTWTLLDSVATDIRSERFMGGTLHATVGTKPAT